MRGGGTAAAAAGTVVASGAQQPPPTATLGSRDLLAMSQQPAAAVGAVSAVGPQQLVLGAQQSPPAEAGLQEDGVAAAGLHGPPPGQHAGTSTSRWTVLLLAGPVPSRTASAHSGVLVSWR